MFVPLILNLLGQHVWPGTGGTKLRVERPAAPGRLDNQDGFLQLLLHRGTKSELRPNLSAIPGGLVSTGAKTCGQFPQAFAIRTAVIRPGQIGHPDLVTYARRSIGIAHFLEQGCRGGIFADVVKGADFSMSLHVRLASQDENPERLGETIWGEEAQQRCGEYEIFFHGCFVSESFVDFDGVRLNSLMVTQCLPSIIRSGCSRSNRTTSGNWQRRSGGTERSNGPKRKSVANHFDSPQVRHRHDQTKSSSSGPACEQPFCFSTRSSLP